MLEEKNFPLRECQLKSEEEKKSSNIFSVVKHSETKCDVLEGEPSI
jgi:hypothetical protein